MIDYNRIPERLMNAMEAYVYKKQKPGDFLCAVIRNDLAQAVGRADEHSIKVLKEIVVWFYNEAPAKCWGSPKNMHGWLTVAKDRNGVILKDGDICYNYNHKCEIKIINSSMNLEDQVEVEIISGVPDDSIQKYGFVTPKILEKKVD